MKTYGSLGIDSAAIDEYYRQCEEMVSKVLSFAKKYGYKDDAETLDADLRKRIFADLRLDDTTKNITTEIINSCLQVTGNLLEDTRLFDDLGLCVDGSADSSNRYICAISTNSGEIYYSDNLERLLDVRLAALMRDRICDQIGSELDLETKHKLFTAFLTGLQKGKFNEKDVIACIHEYQMTQVIKAEFERCASVDLETEAIYRECAGYVSGVQIMTEERGYNEPRFDLRKEVANLMASGEAQSEREAILTATKAYLDNSVLLKDCGLFYSHVGYYSESKNCFFTFRFAGDQDGYSRTLQELERDIDKILTGRLATDIERGEYAVEKKTDDTIVLKKKDKSKDKGEER